MKSNLREKRGPAGPEMDVFKPLSPVIPVILLIAVGLLFGRRRKINLGPLTEIIVYLTTPSLVFTSLLTRPLLATDVLLIATGAIGVLVGVGLLIWLYLSFFRFYSPGFILPVLFMNAGNMGIPLALFAFGEQGLQRATLFFIVTLLFQYSLGIYLVSGKGDWKEIFRLPLIYAALLGLFCNLGHIQIPDLIVQPLSLLGYSTIPLMLVILGCRLNEVQSVVWGHSVGGALVRMGGGFASAYLVVNALGIDGVNRQVVLLYGSLPSAVVNYVLTERYGQDPELAASIIFLTTLLSFVAIPSVFWLIL